MLTKARNLGIAVRMGSSTMVRVLGDSWLPGKEEPKQKEKTTNRVGS